MQTRFSFKKMTFVVGRFGGKKIIIHNSKALNQKSNF